MLRRRARMIGGRILIPFPARHEQAKQENGKGEIEAQNHGGSTPPLTAAPAPTTSNFSRFAWASLSNGAQLS